MLNEILSKTKEGKSLNLREIKELSKELGILKSWRIKLLITIHTLIFLFLLMLSLGFLWIDANIYLLFIPIIYLFIAIIIQNNIPYYKKIINYFKAIDVAFDRVLTPYSNYNIMLTPSIQANEYLEKNTVLFITNNYDFICYDEFLTTTSYILKNYKKERNIYRYLRIIDEKSIHKRPLIFKLHEIISFTHIVTIDKVNQNYDYRDYSIILIPMCYLNYVLIELTDNRIIKLGENIIEALREAAPSKEKKNE